MNNNNYSSKRSTLATIFLVTLFAFASCSDNIVSTEDYSSKYNAAMDSYGYIENAVAPIERLVDLYNGGTSRQVIVGMTKRMDRAVDFKVSVDEATLKSYNQKNDHQFEMFPIELVSIDNDGVTTIAAGAKKGSALRVEITSSPALELDKTYAIPLKISTSDKDVVLDSEQRQYFFFVKFKGDRKNPDKKAGFKVASCFAPQNVDPRLHGEFFLKEEGKPLFDIVILFSGNMNYDVNSGRVYLQTDPQMTTVLNNRERYLKPLQDMGIKVVLSVMGNWDPAGVSHLERPVAELFAQDLKAAVDGFGLDGIFWDDEYTKPNPSIPGFTDPSKENASRLVYETKRLMPDKLSIIYQYGYISSLNTIDGKLPGEYVDYVMADYGSSISLPNWPGATKKQCMPYSWELDIPRPGDPDAVKRGDWGGIMVFGLSEHRSNWISHQLPTLKKITSTLFEDELNYTGVSYPLEY